MHWGRANVGFTMDPSVEANVAGATEATKHAMQSWSGTVGAPELAMKPRGEKAPEKPALDFENGIFFMKSGYEPAGRSLAITILTYDNVTGEIVDADVAFNGRYTFAVLEEQAPSAPEAIGPHPTATDGIAHEMPAGREDTVYDLHHVVAHELGHSLGMDDELRQSDVLMYRYSAPNDPSVRAPVSDDIAGLATIYSSRFAASGSGCGGAMVAPKKPSQTNERIAMIATFTLLAFLVLRARTDRRARIAFLLAMAGATTLLLPELAADTRTASASPRLAGHARGTVVAASTAIEDGLFKTTYELATTACRVAACPKQARGAVWGGTIGHLRQEVAGQFVPAVGSQVDVSFDALPSALGALESPLGKAPAKAPTVTTLTAATEAR